MQLLLSAGACSGINDGCMSADQLEASSFCMGFWCDSAGIENALHVIYIDASVAADDRALSSFKTQTESRRDYAARARGAMHASLWHIRFADFVCRDRTSGR